MHYRSLEKKQPSSERERANEATVQSNAMPLVFYLGLNYSRSKQPPPLERRLGIGLYITFVPRGNSRGACYIPPEMLLWGPAPAVPLMTSSISGGPSWNTIMMIYNLFTSVVLCFIVPLSAAAVLVMCVQGELLKGGRFLHCGCG